jgi:hypothetical protein
VKARCGHAIEKSHAQNSWRIYRKCHSNS